MKSGSTVAGPSPEGPADPPAGATPWLSAGPAAPVPIHLLGVLVDWTLVLMGGVMATLIFANVLAHGLFHFDLAITTEFCELLMVWVTFLGAATATRRGAHMRIGEFVERLSRGSRRIADAAIQLIVLLTLALLVWFGANITEMGRMSTLTVSGWPMASVYLALPVASAITMVFVGWDLYQILVLRRSNHERYGAIEP